MVLIFSDGFTARTSVTAHQVPPNLCSIFTYSPATAGILQPTSGHSRLSLSEMFKLLAPEFGI
jgi:hypothetical protein